MKKHIQPRKYLQACEIGGSIYGKVPSNANTRAGNNGSEGKDDKDDLVDVYNSFYKKQFDAFDRVFRRRK